MSKPMQTQKLTYKICIVGDEKVGKTSLVRRIVDFSFEEKPTPYPQTIVNKEMKINGKDIKIDFFDPIRDEATGNTSFYHQIDMLIIVYNTEDKKSLCDCKNWADYCSRCIPPKCTRLIVGTHTSTKILSQKEIDGGLSHLNYHTFLVDCSDGEGTVPLWEFVCSDIQKKLIPLQASPTSVFVNAV